ncbi:hypothetical protein [Mangrovihabitans endophyticus]|nr:hypothetical protein [Mangrovihabitans endophyticus]
MDVRSLLRRLRLPVTASLVMAALLGTPGAATPGVTFDRSTAGEAPAASTVAVGHDRAFLERHDASDAARAADTAAITGSSAVGTRSAVEITGTGSAGPAAPAATLIGVTDNGRLPLPVSAARGARAPRAPPAV